MTEGRKDDRGKARWDLIPWPALAAIVSVLTWGATHYGDDNWRNVPDAKRRYTAALFRHVTAWLQGEARDRATGEHHLAHAGCCVLFLLALEKVGSVGVEVRAIEEKFACPNCARDWTKSEARLSMGEIPLACPKCGEELDPKPEA